MFALTSEWIDTCAGIRFMYLNRIGVLIMLALYGLWDLVKISCHSQVKVHNRSQLFLTCVSESMAQVVGGKPSGEKKT